MTDLPTLEDYLNTAQRNTKSVFLDMELASGSLELNALGLPRVRSGNFAIIFKVRCSKKTYAVRCFLHMPSDLKERYKNISDTLHKGELKNANVFSDFTFLEKGIVVNGKPFPIVKMEWINGLTLGEFINKYHNDSATLINLKSEIRTLQSYLYDKQIAHGDLQPGNLIVSKEGLDLKLIDYDGMFVPGLKGKKASELGHSNFQHPERNKDNFHSYLDWFGFIQLDVSLTFLIENPNLWDLTYSDEEGILFRATDLTKPLESKIFFELSKQVANINKLDAFTEICINHFSSIPNPKHFYSNTFIAKKNYTYKPPFKSNKSTVHTIDKSNPYLSDYQIVNGNKFPEINGFIGKRVEIVGKVVDVREGKSQFGLDRRLRPYIYLDMDELKKGKLFRIKFLPDIVEGAILSGSSLPNKKWIGKWVTITETIQPKNILNHPSFPSGLSEVFILVNNLNQVKVLSESEARYRLEGSKAKLEPANKPKTFTNLPKKLPGNQSIIDRIKKL